MLEERTVVQVSAGFMSTCALAVLPGNTAGRVFCWGDNSLGQLGNNTTVGSAKPVPVLTAAGTAPAVGLPEGETIIKVASGRGYACAVTAAGRAYCWGSNASGQLGTGNTTSSLSPRLITSTLTSGVKNIFASSGTKTTCALQTQSGADRLYCWGNNRQGQVGVGTVSTPAPNQPDTTNPFYSLPQLVNSNFGIASGHVLDVSIGGYITTSTTDINASDSNERGYICAVGGGNRGYCWGTNRYAATGHSSGTLLSDDQRIVAPQEIFYSSFQSGGVNYANYTRTTGTGNIEKIITGWGTACALRITRPAGTAFEGSPPADPYHSTSPTGKALLCWGSNELSNLGLNDASAAKSGIQNEWTSVPLPPDANTTSSMLALRVPRHMPAFLPNSELHTTGISELYGGGHRMCVITGGKLYCWGNNAAGQVGTSRTTASPIAWPILADLVENLRGIYYY